MRSLLREASPEEAARAVLGSTLIHAGVRAQIVEVEAYGGPSPCRFPDPAAHTWPGPTARNQVMFGDAGHLYVYLSHGIHTCANVTYGPVGQGGGILLRAAEITAGDDDVAARRPGVEGAGRARGPGNLGRALGITLAHGGTDLLSGTGPLRLDEHVATAGEVCAGPRVGVSRAADRRWRFWISGHPAVSAYRRSPRAPSRSDAGDGEQ